MPYQGSEMTAEVVFENPVSMVLTDCKVTVSGSGLLLDVQEIKSVRLISQVQKTKIYILLCHHNHYHRGRAEEVYDIL